MLLRRGDLVICIAAWLALSSSLELTPAGVERSSEFVSGLLQQNFVSCTILLIAQDPEYPDSFDDLVHLKAHDTFLLQLDQEQVKGHSNPNNNNSILPQADVHRHRSSCTVAIFVLSPNFSLKTGNWLYSLIKEWSGVIKKDEDYYVFLSPVEGESPQSDVLLKSDIALGIKYKILVEGSNHALEISTTCFYCDGGSPKIHVIPWREETTSQRNLSLASLFPDLSTNFWGKTLSVGTPTGTRWLNEITFDASTNTWVPKRGLYSIVMSNLMASYNFSANFFPSLGNGGTGSKLPNGTWLGSVGNVLGATAELGHVTGQTWSRNKVVGFTYPVSYEMLTFTSGQPRPYFSWRAILWPLAKEMWLGLGVSFIVSNFVLLLIIKRTPEHFDLTHILSYTFASVLEQDVPSAERLSSPPFRVFVTFWLFFTLVVSTAYRSKLVSLLSFPNVEEAPKTFEALAASDYTYALQYLRGAAYALLRTSPNPTYKTIFDRMQLEEDDVRCFTRAAVVGARFVCISWSRIADFVFKRNLSDVWGRVPVVKAGVTTCFLSVGIIMGKRAIYLGNFNRVIIAATDSGLLERWWVDDMNWVYNERRNWERGAGQGMKKEGRKEESGKLTNGHFRGSYYLLGVGCGVAALVWVGEVMLWRRRLKRKKEVEVWLD